MGLFSNKRSLGSVRRRVRRFDPVAQEEGLELFEWTEDTFVQVGAPSALGVGVLLAALAASGLSEDSPTHTEAGACALMGYACRMAQDALSKNDYSHVMEPHLARDSTGAVDLEQMRSEDNDQFVQLVEAVAELADEPLIAWESSRTLVSAEAWLVFSAFATYALHTNLLEKGLPRAALIPEDGMENLMRLGYVIRIMDEAAGLSPLMKQDIGSQTAAS